MVSLLFSDAVHSAPVLLCCIIARKNREVQASPKGIAALHSHGVPAAVCAHKRFSRVDFSFSRRTAAFGCKRNVFDRYLFVAGWEIIFAVAALVMLLAKCRFSSKRKYLPAIILTCSVVYAAVYASGTRWMQVVGGDLTAVQCLFVATLLETCIACGLIPTNTGYGALFSAATMRVQIADEKYNVCYASANAPELSAELMRLAEVGDVDTGDGFLLRSSRIPGGHVLWMEDISAINELLEELESNRAEIAESNNLERENYNTKLRINALREKTDCTTCFRNKRRAA